MGAPEKLGKPVYITTVLEQSQHEALEYIAYKKRKPMVELIREAIARFVDEAPTLRKKTKKVATSSL